MKMSEINENLAEAPEAYGDKPNTLGKRLGNKLKKHTPFSKKTRDAATAKDEIFKQAKELKNKFGQFMQNYPAGKRPTIAHLEKFFSDTEYAQYVDAVATKLKFKKPVGQPDVSKETEPTAEPEVQPEAEPVATDKSKTDGADQSEEEIRAAYKKQGDELEAERLAKGDDDDVEEEVEEDANDDTEPKVDLSASIYESRLRRMLLEKKMLTDNEVDTFLVRLIQKKNQDKGNADNIGADAETTSDEEPTTSKGSKAAKSSSSGKVSDEEFEDIAENLQDILRTRVRKIISSAKIDESEKKKMLSELDSMIVDVILDLRN